MPNEKKNRFTPSLKITKPCPSLNISQTFSSEKEERFFSFWPDSINSLHLLVPTVGTDVDTDSHLPKKKKNAFFYSNMIYLKGAGKFVHFICKNKLKDIL